MKQVLRFIFLLILSGCAQQEEFQVVFNDSTGLSKESQVLVNGYQIGEINKLHILKNYKTLVTIKLTEEIHIPTDSRFVIVKNSLLGDASINVELGNSETLVSTKDTILGLNNAKPTEIETNILRVVKNLAELTDSLKQESD